ncbi:MAG: hypothetical protein R3C97_09575 [Geminicoccaceae bacterium]
MSVQPGEQVHNRREIPPGEGLFTGTSGEFVIIRGESGSTRPKTGNLLQSSE